MFAIGQLGSGGIVENLQAVVGSINVLHAVVADGTVLLTGMSSLKFDGGRRSNTSLELDQLLHHILRAAISVPAEHGERRSRTDVHVMKSALALSLQRREKEEMKATRTEELSKGGPAIRAALCGRDKTRRKTGHSIPSNP